MGIKKSNSNIFFCRIRYFYTHSLGDLSAMSRRVSMNSLLPVMYPVTMVKAFHLYHLSSSIIAMHWWVTEGVIWITIDSAEVCKNTKIFVIDQFSLYTTLIKHLFTIHSENKDTPFWWGITRYQSCFASYFWCGTQLKFFGY